MSTEQLTIAQRLGRGKIRTKRSRSLGTKLTLSEERDIVRAAEAEGKSASEWARDVLIREARRPKNDVLLTETIATRILLLNLLKPLVRGQKISEDYITDLIVKVRNEKREATLEILEQYAAAERFGS